MSYDARPLGHDTIRHGQELAKIGSWSDCSEGVAFNISGGAIMKSIMFVSCALVYLFGTAYADEPSKGNAALGHKQQRTIHSKTDLAVAPGMEAIVLTVDGAPGLYGKKHYHPGDEFIYLAEGTLILDVAGKGKVTLKKGDTLHIPGRVVHQAINASHDTPFKAVTFGIFEKGQPDTTVVGE